MGRPVGRPKKIDSEKYNFSCKESIINCTIGLISEKPVHEVTLAEIAETLGISKGTIFHYYKTKELLIKDVTDKYMNDLAQELLDWVDDKNEIISPYRYIRSIIRKGSQLQETSRLYLHLMHESLKGEKGSAQQFASKTNDLEKAIETSLKRRFSDTCKDPEITARILMIIVDGLIIQGVDGEGLNDMDRIIGFFADIIAGSNK